MPIESYCSSFPEESIYITVRSPPGFIHQENEPGWYFNATIQLLYSNVLVIILILNIDCYTMMNSLDKNNKDFSRNYQKIMIVKEIQKKFGEIYLGGVL